jgi:hypothetical protein
VTAQQVSNDAMRKQIAETNALQAEAVEQLNDAYNDLAMKLDNMKFQKEGVSGSGLSPSLFAVVVMYMVFGTLGFVMSALPLLQRYGPGLIRRVRSLVKRGKDEEEEEEEEESGTGDESGDSGTEGEESDPESPTSHRQPRISSSAAKALAQTRYRMQTPHH